MTQVKEKSPKEILDSGSTVKLMKSREPIHDIKKSKKKLLMATNGGDGVTDDTCVVPEFGDPVVW